MNKTAFLLFAIIPFIGCKKDTIAPVMTLNGTANDTISLQGAYIELSATATDNEDGNIDVTIIGTVNVNLKGTYVINYEAKDEAGNEASIKRTIVVVNDAEKMAGSYYCTVTPSSGSPFSYTQNITTSDTANKVIFFSRFKNHSDNSGIYAKVTSNSSLNIPAQNNKPGTKTYAGFGTITGNDLNLTYTETSSSLPASYTETLIKQ